MAWNLSMVVAAMSAALVAVTCSASHGSQTGSGGSGGTTTTGPGSGGATSTGTLTGSGGFNPASGSSSGAGGSMMPMCDPSCKAAGGTCNNGDCSITENPGNVTPTVQKQLEGGGNADPSFKWLYPYDATVFPRGLLSPTMQFNGGSPDAIYVHVSFSGMDYKGFFAGANPIRVALPDASWKAITSAAKAKDQVKVEVTKSSGGQIAGPLTETWTIAQGNMRGTIYYETYNSGLAGEVGIMKILPGASQPSVLKQGCGNVCHTASADGSTLVAAVQLGFSSASYDLKNNAATIQLNNDYSFTYGGIYPDGSFVVTDTQYRTWTGQSSHLVSTKTGQQINTPSWTISQAAAPAFSPDGKWIVFNNWTQGNGHALFTEQYDKATNTFSNLAQLTSDGGNYLGWPAFTPDSKWVVYHAGSNQQFETDNGAHGDLFIVDSATKQTARLDMLDGYKNGQSYLPASDPDLNFAPTVLPEAVGGYFWTVFTSHRSYGNTLQSGDNNGKLWVAAIDLQPTDGKDASHPAFYLDGQEVMADNLRGFWVLDPCKADGNNCMSGDECCGGYCTQPADGGPATCSPVSMGCSKEFDKCTTAADCCDPADLCINGHCAQSPPK